MKPGWLVLSVVVATLVVGASGCKTSANRVAQQVAQNQWLQQNQATILEDVSSPEPALEPVTHFAAGQLFEKQEQFARV